MHCKAVYSDRAAGGGSISVSCDPGWFLTGCSAWSWWTDSRGSAAEIQDGDTCTAANDDPEGVPGTWAVAVCCTVNTSSTLPLQALWTNTIERLLSNY